MLIKALKRLLVYLSRILGFNSGLTSAIKIRKTEEIIGQIKSLVNTKGYIYALCMILFEDFHMDPEKLHEIDNFKRISTKEASLLLGFLIQNEIDFTTPDSPEDLFLLRKNTYELLEELHQSFMSPFIEKLQDSIQKEHKKEDIRKEKKAFFGHGNMLAEPIFYSGTGVYDIQYLDFLERKYKYDKNWLLEEKNFEMDQIKIIIPHIKNILEEKSKKVNLVYLKERRSQVLEDLKKKYPKENLEERFSEILPAIELHQYVDLFFDNIPEDQNLSINEIRKLGWKSFYSGLIELFIIRKSDFGITLDFDSFINNFSISYENNLNHQFKTVGNYNIINSNPIIKLDEDRYFVPITFLIYEAVYEAPFYWMIKHKDYSAQAGKNRGKSGEEITYEFLLNVFGRDRTYKSVTITSKKGHDDTDIDVLCILGSKALCVQVKSKKLTELARTGDDNQLHKDFNGAVQDAYEQGLLSRLKILGGKSRFFDENGVEINLSEEIDEVYLMGITTENYPSLTHQVSVMLDKKDNEPFPIVLTIFDLELLAYYLNDPFDLLYYIRQRIKLMDFFHANEEISFLGYHLDQKLWKIPSVDFYVIDNSFAQLIDRNYFPIKAGLEVSDDGDVIKNRWRNQDFEKLCNQLKSLNQAKITDIIFHLLDWSGEARDNLVDYIIRIKQKTIKDRKNHNFSIPPDYEYFPRVGVTYYSLNSNNGNELNKKLLTLCEVRKYKSKGDVWIGFGSLFSSNEMIDLIVFNDQTWKYDKELEELSKLMLEGLGQGQQIRIGHKIGRNEQCYCGSRLKYKNCCGKN